MTTLSRIENRLAATAPDPGPFSPLVLNAEEEQIIREHLGINGPVKGRPQFTIGDPVPESEVKPVPDSLAAALPKLKGAKYMFDANGWAIIVGAGSRVVATIGPA